MQYGRLLYSILILRKKTPIGNRSQFDAKPARKMMKFFVLFTLFGFALSQCPSDLWYRFRNKCFYFKNERVTFHQALKNCEDLNASMISIHSEDENNYLKSILKADEFYFLGLRQFAKDQKAFAWMDGTLFNYSHWAKNEPNNINEPEWIAEWINGDWFDYLDVVHRSWICQIALPGGDKTKPKQTQVKLIDEIVRRWGNDEQRMLKMEAAYKEMVALQKDTYARINEVSVNLSKALNAVAESIRAIGQRVDKLDKDSKGNFDKISRTINENFAAIPEGDPRITG